MNYFILGQDGQVQGPHTLDALRALLASGQIMAVTQVCPEGANNWSTLSAVLQKSQPAPQPVPQPVAQPVYQAAAPIAQPISMQQRRRGSFTAETHLADIRSRSCYATLRLVINILVGIGLAFIGITFLITLFAALSGASRAGTQGVVAIVTVIVTYAIAVVGVIATRQLWLLLVDIADTLLFEHTRNRNETEQ